MKPIISLALVVISAAGVPQPTFRLSPNDVRQDTVDAQEAVIRYLIDRHGIDVPYYCI
jgi:hypothetical protein